MKVIIKRHPDHTTIMHEKMERRDENGQSRAPCDKVEAKVKHYKATDSNDKRVG